MREQAAGGLSVSDVCAPPGEVDALEDVVELVAQLDAHGCELALRAWPEKHAQALAVLRDPESSVRAIVEAVGAFPVPSPRRVVAMAKRIEVCDRRLRLAWLRAAFVQAGLAARMPDLLERDPAALGGREAGDRLLARLTPLWDALVPARGPGRAELLRRTAKVAATWPLPWSELAATLDLCPDDLVRRRLREVSKRFDASAVAWPALGLDAAARDAWVADDHYPAWGRVIAARFEQLETAIASLWAPSLRIVLGLIRGELDAPPHVLRARLAVGAEALARTILEFEYRRMCRRLTQGPQALHEADARAFVRVAIPRIRQSWRERGLT